LSRLEKKSRVVMLDRQVLLMDYRELQDQVAHLRRLGSGGGDSHSDDDDALVD